ncbi:MAG: MBL fold metallo-hydrolase [Kiritimatiellae bacterium]|nr:MBL fold metallo-hydrolase [Kiritimatiellia bacterium]
MNRRTFLTMGTAAAVGVAGAQSMAVKRRVKAGDADPVRDVAPVTDAELDAAVKTLEATSMTDDERRLDALRVVQRAIDRMLPTPQFKDAMRESSSARKVKAALAKFPVMRWYDRAFGRVVEDFRRTTPEGGKPAVWYLYNMGVVVKTGTCAFGIDICHRRAAELLPLLDFALVTHNHGDHFNMGFLRKMTAAGKPVVSNFHLAWNWYCREFEKTLKVKDVTVHCTAADHNKHLPYAVTNFEVVCGDAPGAFTLFHSGDCNRADHLKPRGRPDVYFGHCAIGLDFMAAAKTTMPAKLYVPLHHQELGHLGGPWRCVAFEDEPLKIVRSLRAAGFNAAMPVWGDRIV